MPTHRGHEHILGGHELELRVGLSRTKAKTTTELVSIRGLLKLTWQKLGDVTLQYTPGPEDFQQCFRIWQRPSELELKDLLEFLLQCSGHGFKVLGVGSHTPFVSSGTSKDKPSRGKQACRLQSPRCSQHSPLSPQALKPCTQKTLKLKTQNLETAKTLFSSSRSLRSQHVLVNSESSGQEVGWVRVACESC